MNTAAAQLFFILLGSGLLLLGAEIFVPGGILGVFGGILLLGAMISGFSAFPGSGHFVAFGILLLIGIAIVLWIRFFPRSRVGKAMTMSRDESQFTSTQDGLKDLIGVEGQAQSDLRPAGFALINGRRVDVVTQGEMIGKGQAVTVVRVESNRVVVQQSKTSKGESSCH